MLDNAILIAAVSFLAAFLMAYFRDRQTAVSPNEERLEREVERLRQEQVRLRSDLDRLQKGI